MEPIAYRMAIPNEFYEKQGIRGYGFHGTSHKFVSEIAVKLVQKPDSESHHDSSGKWL